MRKFFVLMLVLVGAMLAFGEQAKSGLYLDTSLGASINYLGLGTENTLFYRIPLSKGGGILWESTHIDVGIYELLSPSFTMSFLYLQIEPIAVFDITIKGGYIYEFDFLTGGYFPMSTNSDFDDAARAAMTAQPLSGWRLMITPRVKFEVGKLAGLYSLNMDYHYYPMISGYYYDAYTVTIMNWDDIYLEHNAVLLYKLSDNLRIGANWKSGSVQSWGYTTSMLTGVVIYTPDWWGKNISPYGFFSVGSHTEDKYMVGKLYVAGLFGATIKLN